MKSLWQVWRNVSQWLWLFSDLFQSQRLWLCEHSHTSCNPPTVIFAPSVFWDCVHSMASKMVVFTTLQKLICMIFFFFFVNSIQPQECIDPLISSRGHCLWCWTYACNIFFKEAYFEILSFCTFDSSIIISTTDPARPHLNRSMWLMLYVKVSVWLSMVKTLILFSDSVWVTFLKCRFQYLFLLVLVTLT